MHRNCNYSTVDSIQGSDKVRICSFANGDERDSSWTTVLAFMQDNLTFNAGVSYDTQYAAPTATGFSVQITDNSNSTHLILLPLATYAAGTIVLPAVGNLIDKQEVLVNCTQIVTTLTINVNGAGAVAGAPTTLAANGFFRLKYDLTMDTWYRVG